MRSLQAERVADHGPCPVQFALKVDPVVGTWAVEIDRRVQAELLHAVRKRPIFRANRRLDLINFGACSVEGPG